MKEVQILDLFSGIGGFTLGADLSRIPTKTVAFCEVNPFCQDILKLRYPNTPIIGDIHDVSTDSLSALGVREIDLITAGVPCQPFSIAGSKKHREDKRNLFPEFFRVLRDIQPERAIVENVPHLLNADQGRFFTQILWDFAKSGYDAKWKIVSVAQQGGVHLRKRLFIFATHTNGNGWDQDA